jgi:pseudouridine-5'-phosphate glycosidase
MSTGFLECGLHRGVVVAEEVNDALQDGAPVVALESTIISHGLPRPRNLQVARELERLVRDGRGCPATIAVLDGVVRIGLDKDELERVASDTTMRKLGFRDLPLALATGASGGTTVSAVSFLAARAGIRVFATGGLGGVHRGWAESWDESADLAMLSRTRLTVVSSGVKSILDIAATLQRLETLNVTVVGYRTSMFPGFYVTSSGYPLDWTVESPEQIADIMAFREALGGPETALVVANPVPEDDQLDPQLHDAVLAEALAAAADEGIRGQALTPFLLDFVARRTGGASVEANLAAVRGNVTLGTAIALAWASRDVRVIHSGTSADDGSWLAAPPRGA